ncbi:MAG: glucosyltransferase domain-containing protein [Neisseriaceae bacterium]|nr:glucosyltransferase domain-containing protein [Neisseriaceae bacterium]
MKFQWNKQYTDAIIIALFIAFPIILAGEPFGDDFYRLRDGETYQFDKGTVTSWRYGGRPLVVWLFQLLSGGQFVFNLFPLPQILGIMIYALSLSWIVQRFNVKDRLMSVLIILSALTVPFMYQNYMYQYDALTICISIAILSITPLVLNPSNKQQWIKYSLIKVLLIMLALLFYATPIPSYFILSLYLYLHSNQNNKFKILFWNIGILIFSYILSTVLLNIFFDTHYIQNNSKVSWDLLPYKIFTKPFELFEGMLLPYYGVSFNWLAPLLLLLSAFAIIFNRLKKESRLERIGGLEKMILFFSIPLMAFVTIIFVSLPDVTIFKHRMYFSLSSAYFCIVFIVLQYAKSKTELLKKIAISVVVIMLIPAITSLYIAMKAYSMQQDYERMLITSIYDGLAEIGLSKDDNQKITFMCTRTWYAPYTKKLLERKPYMADWVYAASNHTPAHIGNYLNLYQINAEVDMILSKKFVDNKTQKIYSHYLYSIHKSVIDNKEKIIICIK